MTVAPDRARVAGAIAAARAQRLIEAWHLDVRIGRLVCLMGVAVSAAWVGGHILTGAADSRWWSIATYAITLLLLAGTTLGRSLPRPAMKTTWWAVSLLGAVVMVTTFQAYSADFDATREMWDLGFQLTPAYLCLLVLVLPDRRAHVWINAAALSYALATGLSFWLTYAILPGTAWIMMLQVYANVIFAMLLVEFRRRMRRFHISQERWRIRELEVTQAKTRLREEREMARVAHDHALGLLNASLLWWAAHKDAAENRQVRIPDELRTMARDSIHLFERMVGEDSPEISTAKVAARIEAARLANSTISAVKTREEPSGTEGAGRVTLRVEPGTLPTRAASALIDATAEAMRNAVRHAGGARWTVTGTLSTAEAFIEIVDEGPGFDPSRIDPDRMGLRSSVLGRMQDLPGGRATIESASTGTLVRLCWFRTSAWDAAS